MTRIHLPGTSSSRQLRRRDGRAWCRGVSQRRALTAAALLAVLPVAAGTVAGSAAASITGYGLVGPDPATQLGLSVPVLTAEVSGPEGSTVRSTLADATISVTRPAGYSDGSQVVSLTDLSGAAPAEALVPADLLEDSHVVLGVGVGVRSVETAEAPGAAATVREGSESLAVQVDSPSLAGTTVVVVGADEPQVVPGDTSVSVDVAGPSAVFALAPGPAPAGTSSGVDERLAGRPAPGQPLAGTSAAATGPDASPAIGAAVLAGALVLGSVTAAGSAVAVARRGARRRTRP